MKWRSEAVHMTSCKQSSPQRSSLPDHPFPRVRGAGHDIPNNGRRKVASRPSSRAWKRYFTRSMENASVGVCNEVAKQAVHMTPCKRSSPHWSSPADHPVPRGLRVAGRSSSGSNIRSSRIARALYFPYMSERVRKRDSEMAGRRKLASRASSRIWKHSSCRFLWISGGPTIVSEKRSERTPPAKTQRYVSKSIVPV
jgi:hypothetical protein